MLNEVVQVHTPRKKVLSHLVFVRNDNGKKKFNRNQMKLIKQLNDTLKAPDPVTEAIKSLQEGEDWATQLDDQQVDMLVDYMKEMIDFAQKRGQQMPPEEAASMALEDVAGFETASQRVIKTTVARLVQAYLKKT